LLLLEAEGGGGRVKGVTSGCNELYRSQTPTKRRKGERFFPKEGGDNVTDQDLIRLDLGKKQDRLTCKGEKCAYPGMKRRKEREGHLRRKKRER